MNPTIDLKVCPKCDFASEAAGNFCPNCGQAFGGSTNSKFHGSGNEFYRDEYGWQQGSPPGDPRADPRAQQFWSNHKVVEDELYMPTTDFLAGLIGLVGAGLAIYGACKLIEKISDQDKLLNEGK